MDLAKVGDKVACSCKGGPHRIVSGANTAKVDGIPIARVGDKSSCGASITSGVAWYPIEGSAAAVNGSATSCGGQLVTGCSTEVGSPSTPAVSLLTEPKDIEVPALRYREFSEPFLKVTPDYMLAEGLGVHASYNLRGHVTLHSSTLSVSAMGRTAASHLGSVDWFVSATLHDGSLIIANQNLERRGISAWSDDDFTPIGHADFSLPMPPRRLTLELNGGYFFSSGTGNLASRMASITFEIEVEPQ